MRSHVGLIGVMTLVVVVIAVVPHIPLRQVFIGLVAGGAVMMM